MPRDNGLEAARTALHTGMAERSLRYDDRASPTDRVNERLGHDGTHEFIIRSEKRVYSDLIEWRELPRSSPGITDPEATIWHRLQACATVPSNQLRGT
jgi:hypothetical protein